MPNFYDPYRHSEQSMLFPSMGSWMFQSNGPEDIYKSVNSLQGMQVNQENLDAAERKREYRDESQDIFSGIPEEAGVEEYLKASAKLGAKYGDIEPVLKYAEYKDKKDNPDIKKIADYFKLADELEGTGFEDVIAQKYGIEDKDLDQYRKNQASIQARGKKGGGSPSTRKLNILTFRNPQTGEEATPIYQDEVEALRNKGFVPYKASEEKAKIDAKLAELAFDVANKSLGGDVEKAAEGNIGNLMTGGAPAKSKDIVEINGVQYRKGLKGLERIK